MTSDDFIRYAESMTEIFWEPVLPLRGLTRQEQIAHMEMMNSHQVVYNGHGSSSAIGVMAPNPAPIRFDGL